MASRASCAPCDVAGGKPPSASEICSAVMLPASAGDFPRSISVKSDEQASAVTQPRVRNLASAIRPASVRTESSRISPQTGFSTDTTAVAESSVPAFRGF